MLQKRWFKLFIWFASTAFFFLVAAILISYFDPEPKEKEIMSYMSGMMGAMHGSLMGFSMGMEEDNTIKSVIAVSVKITIPLIIIGFLSGILVRVRRGRIDK